MHGNSRWIMINSYINITPNHHLNSGTSAATTSKIINNDFRVALLLKSGNYPAVW